MTPREVEEQIHAYDEWLRLRWGKEMKQWRLERKIRYGTYFNPGMFDSYDDWECANQGYCLVLRIPKQVDNLYSPTLGGSLTHVHDGLDGRIIYTLWQGDIARRGGSRQVADEMDNAYYGRLGKSKAAWGDKLEYLARERWNSMNTFYPGKAG